MTEREGQNDGGDERHDWNDQDESSIKRPNHAMGPKCQKDKNQINNII